MKKPLPIHPFLFAVYPILFLVSENLGQVIWHEVIPFPIALSLSICLILYVLFALILRSASKAALIVSLLCLMFFSYGHVFEVVKGWGAPDHRIIFSAWVLAFLGISFFLFRINTDLAPVHRFLGIAGLVLIMIPVFAIGKREMKTHFKENIAEASTCSAVPVALDLATSGVSGGPDIYYFILDGYANAESLKEHFNFDNHEFVADLKEMGFYIAEDSHSNYASTTLSIASSLNMEYLDSLVPAIQEDSDDRSSLFDRVRDSNILNFIKTKGYAFVHFISPFSIVADNPCADVNVRCIYNNEFLLQLVKVSALSPFEQVLNVVREDFRKGILKTFSELKKVAEHESPKLVFAHIITPHPPFLFGPNGEAKENAALELDGEVWDQKTAYVDQITFLNKKLKGILETILTKSSRKPIIILQADHGSSTSGDWKNPDETFIKERMGIFHALLLPEGGDKVLYPSLTPVNSFRLIFNHYLDGDFEILKDRVYFSTYEKPFRLRDVTEKVK